MSGTLRFRRAGIDDAGILLELYAGLGDQPRPDATAVARYFERIARYPAYELWLAELDAIAVATCCLLVMDNLAHGGAPVGVVESVAVHRDHRGRGLGRALMDHAAARAAAAGCYKLMLSSNRRREEAHAFYQRLGYRLHGYSLALPLGQEATP